jgi:hypothetical protein
MAFRLSTGLRTGLLGTWGFKELMDNGWLDIYTGSQPTHPDYVETGTKLVRISSTCGAGVDDGCKFGTAGTGVLPIGGVAWQGVVLADGVAGWARYYASSGTGGQTGTSGTAIRFDLSVGVSGADLNLSHTSLTTGATLTITAANVTQPEE